MDQTTTSPREGAIREIEDLIQKGWEINRAQPAESLKIGQNALEQATEKDDPHGIANANTLIGTSEVWLGNYRNAFVHLFDGLQAAKELEDFRCQIKAQYFIGTTYYFLGNHELQLEFGMDAYNTAKNHNLIEEEASALNMIGTAYYSLDQNDQAITALNDALQICEKAELQGMIPRILDGLGESHFNKQEYKVALEYKTRCLEIAREGDVGQTEAYALDGMGCIYTKLQDYDTAIKCFKESFKIRKDSNFRAGQVQTIMHLGELFLTAGDHIKAKKYLRRGLKNAIDLESKDLIFECHFYLSELYEKMGDLKEFAYHFREYHKYKEQHFREQEKHKITGLEVHLKMDQIEQEKDLLATKNQELESHVKHMQTLGEIGEKLSSTLDLEEVLVTTYESVNSLMDAEIFLIGVHDPEDETLHMKFILEKGERFPARKLPVAGPRLASMAFRNNEEVVINNYEEGVVKYYGGKGFEGKLEGDRPESIVYIPIYSQGEPAGIISVQSFEANAYSEYQLNILRNLAVYVGSALHNAKTYGQLEEKVTDRTEQVVEQKEQIERTLSNTRIVSELGQTIIASKDLNESFAELQGSIDKIMDASIFSVRVLDQEKQTINFEYTFENGKQLPPITISMDDDDNYSVICIKKQQEIFINDHEVEYARYTDKIVVVAGELPQSLIFCPLIVGDKVVGCVTAQSMAKHAYTEYHLDLLRTLGSYIAIALENKMILNGLEDEVAERTKEVTAQKEEIQKTFEDTQTLGEIGKKITSTLSVAEIISSAYKQINDLMDATVFGIGLHSEKRHALVFYGAMEKGVKLDEFEYKLDDDRIATTCFNNLDEIVINNWGEEYTKYVRKKTTAIKGEQPNSMVYLPLMAKGDCLGVVTVQSFGVNTYNDYHLNILRNLSVYIGIGLDNARLYENMEGEVQLRTKEVVQQKEALERSYESTKLLGEIGQHITSNLNFENIFSEVHENLQKLMDAPVFGIRVWHEKENQIEYKYEIEKGKRYESEFVSAEDKNNLSVWCIENKKDLLINDLETEHTKYVDAIALVGGDQPVSLLFSPMIVGSKVIGCITVQSFDKNAYQEYQLDILKTLASYTAVALENANLYENLEEKVKARTAEVVKQKEELERASSNTELLSQIGKQITSLLSVEDIISQVYERLNTLMDAGGFGIGIINSDGTRLDFPAYIEKGKSYGGSGYELDEPNRIANVCFLEEKEILIGNYVEEATQYVDELIKPVAGEFPESVIYLPLYNKGKAIGVITTQSWTKEAYADFELNVVRNLAVYVAIAMENAGLYQNMERKVEERTAEVVKQKEELEKTYQDTETLSKIGRDITSSIHVDQVVRQVYENVNSLMDATMFGIGIYDPDQNAVAFPGFIENSVALEGVTFPMDETDRLAVVCLAQNREIFINNFFEEYSDYVDKALQPVAGKDSGSIIYLPLRKPDGDVIGVITVQSYEVDQYSEYHLNLLRSMAVYVAIAIDNATLYQNLEDKVEERTAEVVEQKEIIEQKNKHITDSIHYAKRLQDAILPNIGRIKDHVEDAFVLFKPKDIVSGDFYWIHKHDNRIVVSVIDCTGHGVPGAFMSLIGYDGLSDVIINKEITEPAEILNRLNNIVTQRLNQKREETTVRDGMDMSVCTIDISTLMMEFAGAQNSIYHIRKGVLQIFKTDRFPVGAFIDDMKQDYTNYEFQLRPGDIVYLISDGYADQFGGATREVRDRGGKKFKYKQFEKLLMDIHTHSMERQEQMLRDRFDEWKGEIEQLDDVCVLGFKV